MQEQQREMLEHVLAHSEHLTGKEWKLFSRILAADEAEGYDLTARDIRHLVIANDAVNRKLKT